MLRIPAHGNYGALQEVSAEQWTWHQKCNILKTVLLHLLSPPPPPGLQRGLGRWICLYFTPNSAPLIQASEQLPPDTMTLSTKALCRVQGRKESADYPECDR